MKYSNPRPTRTSKPYDIMSLRIISWFIHCVVGQMFGLKLFNDCLVDDPRLILKLDNNFKITIVTKLCDLARGIIAESHCRISFQIQSHAVIPVLSFSKQQENSLESCFEKVLGCERGDDSRNTLRFHSVNHNHNHNHYRHSCGDCKIHQVQHRKSHNQFSRSIFAEKGKRLSGAMYKKEGGPFRSFSLRLIFVTSTSNRNLGESFNFQNTSFYHQRVINHNKEN